MKNHLNKKQRTLSIIALLSAAMGIAGCNITWDDDDYKAFVNDDESIAICEYFNKLQFRDGSSIQFNASTNKYLNNKNEEVIPNEIFLKAFEIKLCPAGFTCSESKEICTEGECPTGLTQCKGSCIKVSEKDDDNNSSHVESCINNIIKCHNGYVDCDNDASTGCEINLASSNLKSCENNQYECIDGYGDCDNSLTTGCESKLTTNEHCGSCSNNCSSDKKVCLQKEENQYECDVDQCANTPETPNTCLVEGNNICKNIHSYDADHCGACNYKCADHPIANATSDKCIDGECQYICATGYVNVGSGDTAQTIKCIDPYTDNSYCGAKLPDKNKDEDGDTCTGGNVCVEGDCVTNSCKEADAPNLCVVSGQNTCQNISASDENHCGACNYKCAEHAVPNATSDKCESGNCQYTCASGYVNVGTGITADTILCVDPQTNSSYCDATGNASGAASDSQKGNACIDGKVCVSGNCETNSCTDSSKPNLCVVSGQNTCQNINSNDANHCGSCNYKCSEHAIPNATSSKCSSGNCQYTCAAGHVNVGTGITANTILCIDPKTNNSYCNATGNASGGASASQKGSACTGGTVCVDGKCLTNSCPTETEPNKPNLCVVNGNNTCQNINSTDANHCGACNYKCADHAIPNATSSACKNGSCQYTCATGYVNVGTGIAANTILCIDPKTNNTYCNATGNASGAASASQKGTSCTGGTVCVDGSCQTNSCTDSSKPNLCVVNGQNTCQNINSTDANHCGACNFNCSDHAIPNATSSVCKTGDCQYTCTGDYVNVGTGITANTILCIDPKTNNTYCNATGNASGKANDSQKGTPCTSGTVCVNGTCVQNECTNSNETLCSTTSGNQCINIGSNEVNHCGACNYKCSDHAIPNATSNTCKNGDCQYTCTGDYVNVGTGITANTILCIDPQSSNTYCNATGNSTGAASAEQKGTTCSGKTVCVDGNCTTLQTTCSGVTPDLCIVESEQLCKNINSTDADHCGACNYKCSEHPITNATSNQCLDGKCQYSCSGNNFVNIGSGTDLSSINCVDRSSNEHCGAESATNTGTPCPSGYECTNNNNIYSCTKVCPEDQPIKCQDNKCYDLDTLTEKHRISSNTSLVACPCDSGFMDPKGSTENTMVMCVPNTCQDASDCPASAPMCKDLHCTPCPTNAIWNSDDKACKCPIGADLNADGTACVCPTGSHVDSESNSCVCNSEYTDCDPSAAGLQCLKKATNWTGNICTNCSAVESCSNGGICSKSGSKYTCN